MLPVGGLISHRNRISRIRDVLLVPRCAGAGTVVNIRRAASPASCRPSSSRGY